MLTRRVPRRDDRVRSVRRLLREADLAVCNLETLYHDYEFPPVSEGGGTYVRSHPRGVADLRWLGLHAVTLANNHACDYGGQGLVRCIEHLDARGVTVAGAGASRREARAVAYVDTDAGRLALVAATSTAPAHATAGGGYGDVPARPGVNKVVVHEAVALDAEAYDAVRRHVARPLSAHVVEDDGAFVLRGLVFARSKNPTRVVQAMDPRDLGEHAELVAVAAATADFVLVSLHTHERGRDLDEPPSFAVEFAQGMIDAGAHCVFMHGTHRLRGVERHGGGLVCYGLGNFAYQPEGITRVPHDALLAAGCDERTSAPAYLRRRAAGRWAVLEDDERTADSLVVRVHLDRRSATVSASLHAAVLAPPGLPGVPRGTPLACGAEAAERILGHVAALSSPDLRLTRAGDGHPVGVLG